MTARVLPGLVVLKFDQEIMELTLFAKLILKKATTSNPAEPWTTTSQNSPPTLLIKQM
jgi:hypothetical protein